MRRRSVLGMMGVAGVGGAAALTGAATTSEAERLYGHDWDHDAERANNAGPGLGRHVRVGTGRMVWSVDTDARVAALTFDDGPSPALTPRVLDILEAAGATATFMMMGWNAHRHRSLVVEVADAGHEIGNHGWSHLDLAQCSIEQVEREIKKGRDAIEEVLGAPVRWFRPARGVITGRALRVAVETGHDIAMWSLTAAVADSTPSRVEDHVATETRPGDVICLHDGLGRGTFDSEDDLAARLSATRSSELEALPRVIERLVDDGYRFLPLTELVRMGETDR